MANIKEAIELCLEDMRSALMMLRQLIGASPNVVVDASITNLAQRDNISRAEAPGRLRALRRRYGSWGGVADECRDRGWFLKQ